MKPKTFEQVRNYLSTVPSINYGGCGISALSMILWLRQNENYDAKITFCYCDLYSYNRNKSHIRNKDSELNVPSHVAIIYKGKRYDSKGQLPKSTGWHRFEYFHRVSFDVLIDVIDEIDDWNDSFDRKYVKQIEQKLGVSLPILSYEDLEGDLEGDLEMS